MLNLYGIRKCYLSTGLAQGQVRQYEKGDRHGHDPMFAVLIAHLQRCYISVSDMMESWEIAHN